MMHSFLANNRDELIKRCKFKVAKRDRRAFTAEQLKDGIPLFLDQLTRTLQADQAGLAGDSLKISGASGGDATTVSEIGVSAAAHGLQLLKLGFSVDQVVHNYGDLCQAITELAVERDVPFDIEEFRTLNLCLDNAIADAVTEFSFHHERVLTQKQSLLVNQRLGFLVHELRNSLGTAKLAFTALQAGALPVAGATGQVLSRSLTDLGGLIDRTLCEVPEQKHAGRPHCDFA